MTVAVGQHEVAGEHLGQRGHGGVGVKPQILQVLHVEAQIGQVVRLFHVADDVPGGHQFLVGPQQVRAGRVHPASVLEQRIGSELAGFHQPTVQRRSGHLVVGLLIHEAHS